MLVYEARGIASQQLAFGRQAKETVVDDGVKAAVALPQPRARLGDVRMQDIALANPA